MNQPGRPSWPAREKRSNWFCVALFFAGRFIDASSRARRGHFAHLSTVARASTRRKADSVFHKALSPLSEFSTGEVNA
jgi:hypothetical protein